MLGKQNFHSELVLGGWKRTQLWHGSGVVPPAVNGRPKAPLGLVVRDRSHSRSGVMSM